MSLLLALSEGLSRLSAKDRSAAAADGVAAVEVASKEHCGQMGPAQKGSKFEAKAPQSGEYKKMFSVKFNAAKMNQCD